MKRQLLLQMVKRPQPKALTALEVSVDAATTAKVAVVEGATIETKVSSLGTEIAETIPDKKITKAKAEGDSFEEEDNIVNAKDAHNEFYNKA
jgi:hypothetical protein